MKKIKKILAAVMTLAMVLGMSMTSFAANSRTTISVDGLATTGTNAATYVKILEPDVTAPGGYKFVDGVNIYGYTTAKAFMDAKVEDQKAALRNENTTLPGATAGNIENNVFSATVDAGYYVVNITNTAGADEPTITYDNPMIVSVEYDKATPNSAGGYDYNVKADDPDNTVTAKYSSIPVTKDGKDKNNGDGTVEVGGTATYEIITFIPSQVFYFRVRDVLGNATYLPETVKVHIEGVGYLDSETINNIVSYPTTDPDENDMVIDLTDYLANVGKKVTITYDVTVTGTVVNNTVTPDDGNHNYTSDGETLYTGGAQLTKYIEDGETPMENAVFVLYKEVMENGENVKYYAQVDGNNVLTGWTKNEKDESIRLTTGKDGVVYVDGLDIGDYHFKEVEAPSGYSVNPEIKDVKITEANTTKHDPYNRFETEMNDTKLSALPSTGGIGTTIFTVGGCIIMIAAAGLFFASRRKSSK